MPSATKTETLYSNNGSAYSLTASFVETSTDVSSNTSTITCTATISSGNANWSTSSQSSVAIYWYDNRENYFRQVALVTFAGLLPNSSKTATGTITVTHNDDGTLSGYAYAWFEKGNTTSVWAANSGGSGTDWTTLTTIARASQPSINTYPNNSPDFNIGDTITIHMNRKSSIFTHTVTLNLGAYTYQIATNVTNNCTLDTSTIANDLYQQIPNSSVGNGTISVDTYNGAILVGTKSCTFKAHVINSNPTFTPTYLDTNATTVAITNNNKQLIRNNSTLRIFIADATAKNYATLSTLKATINGTVYNGTLNGAIGTINVGTLNLSSNTIAYVELTDSRGINTIVGLSIIILDWELPTAIINMARQNNYYSETDIEVDANYSSLDSKNTISIKMRSKKTSEGSYGAYTSLTDGVTSQFTFDNNYDWDIQILLEDKIGSTTYNLTLGKGIPIVYFDRMNRSVGVDYFPEHQSSLEVAGKVYIHDAQGNSMVSVIDEIEKCRTYDSIESIVGTWIDGKEIYRQVFTGTSYMDFPISTSISNVDSMIEMRLLVRYSGNSSWRTIPWIYGSNTTVGSGAWAGGFYFNDTNKSIEIQMGNDIKNFDKYVLILEYTQ